MTGINKDLATEEIQDTIPWTYIKQTDEYNRVVRILHQKIANSACVTCKFCAPFLWILHTFANRFFRFRIISCTAVWPCLPH